MTSVAALDVIGKLPGPSVTACGARPWKNTGSVAKPSEGPAAKPETAVFALRAATRRLSDSPRTRGCGLWSVRAEGPAIEVRTGGGGARARWVGTLKCGHRWTCPVCARAIMAERRVQILDALIAGRVAEPGKQWTMLTFTVRHDAAMRLRPLLAGLRASWRRTRQRGSVQRIFKARVSASIRALEITDGAHGFHPHLHVLVLTSEWSDAERETLARTWTECVTKVLSVSCTPSAERAVWTSNAVDDRYLAKMGLEITGTAKQNSPWAIAQRAHDTYAIAKKLRPGAERTAAYERGDLERARWREYEEATKGCRAIELDDRAAALAEGGERIRINADGSHVDDDEPAHAHAREIPMQRMLETSAGSFAVMRIVGMLEREHPAILRELLTVAERAPPETAVRDVDAFLLGRMELASQHGHGRTRLEIPA